MCKGAKVGRTPSSARYPLVALLEPLSTFERDGTLATGVGVRLRRRLVVHIHGLVVVPVNLELPIHLLAGERDRLLLRHPDEHHFIPYPALAPKPLAISSFDSPCLKWMTGMARSSAKLFSR